MNHRTLFGSLPLLLVSSLALAAEGSIVILSPKEGEVVSTKDKVPVSYEAEFGPKGNHLHLYLDELRADILRQPKGTDEIRILLPGKHQICLEIETSWHFSTGVRKCVNVIAK